jgi:hypothetical protein
MADPPAETTPAGGLRGALWVGVGALTLAFALTALVPWQQGYPDLTLDGSWVMVLHEAYARGWRFGVDIVFTYGPLGFIVGGSYHPATGNLMLALWVLVAGGFWAVLFALARKLVSSAIVALLLIASAIAVASVGTDSFLFGVVVLVPIVYLAVDRTESKLLHATAALVAFVALVKFTYLVAGVLLVGCVAADVAVRTRRVPRVLLAFAGPWLAGWVASGQRPWDVPAYLFTSLEVASGYGPAMPLDGPIEEVYTWAGLSVAFVAFTFAAARPFPWLLALGFAGWTFIAFKAGFVRHDAHAVAGATALMLALILYGAFVAPRHGRIVKALFVCLLAYGTVAFSGVVETYYRVQFSKFVEWKIRNESVDDAKAALAIFAGTDARPAAYQANLDRLRAKHPVPATPGSVDVFQSLSGLPIAHDLDYRPRPVFQSYVTYSERLARYNAEYLASERAPQFVLVHVDAVDAHAPLAEDAASWPVLLSYYELRDLRHGYVLLERAAVPKPLEITPIATQPAAVLRGTYKVPDAGDDLVWVEISVRRTALGWLQGLLFQIPPPVLHVELQDGTAHDFRLPVAVARGGFILSPALVNEMDFARTVAGEPPRSDRVVRVRVSPPIGAEAYYAPDYALSFKRLHVGGLGTGARVPSSFANLMRLASTGGPPGVGLRQDPAGQPIVFAHAPSTLALEAPAGASRIKVRFGIFEDAWKGKGRSTGVEFRVSTGSGQTARTLWSRVLDPRGVPADRGEQEATIELPSPVDGPLRFETLPGIDPGWDWSYWAGVDPE